MHPRFCRETEPGFCCLPPEKWTYCPFCGIIKAIKKGLAHGKSKKMNEVINMASVNIKIEGGTTIEIAAAAEKLIKDFGPNNIHKIRVDKVNEAFGVEVKIEFIAGLAPYLHEVCVTVCGLSAGFNGTGPHDLIKVLRCAGVAEDLVPDESVFGDAPDILPLRLEREDVAPNAYAKK